MGDFTHLILTRFNVRVAASWSDKALDPTWLAHRFELFETYCVPPMRHQTVRDFRWLIFFDAQTPREWIDRIEAYRDSANIETEFLEAFDEQLWRAAIARHVDHARPGLLTTRLDNDDALSIDSVDRIQRAGAQHGHGFLVFSAGYTIHNGRAYLVHDDSNAFASLYEPAPAQRTVWCEQHQRIRDHSDVAQVPDVPSWAQIIHGRNVSNRVRGRLLPADGIAERFAWEPTLLRAPGPAALAIDRLVRCPLRSTREWLIGKARAVRGA